MITVTVGSAAASAGPRRRPLAALAIVGALALVAVLARARGDGAVASLVLEGSPENTPALSEQQEIVSGGSPAGVYDDARLPNPAFKERTTYGDGKLTEAEFAKFVETLGILGADPYNGEDRPREDVRRHFAELDVDGDGALSRGELSPRIDMLRREAPPTPPAAPLPEGTKARLFDWQVRHRPQPSDTTPTGSARP